ncbi:hypothetical protein PFISCL1PPCAC_21412, partial [Pristionchus fissidentatus]
MLENPEEMGEEEPKHALHFSQWANGSQHKLISSLREEIAALKAENDNWKIPDALYLDEDPIILGLKRKIACQKAAVPDASASSSDSTSSPPDVSALVLQDQSAGPSTSRASNP